MSRGQHNLVDIITIPGRQLNLSLVDGGLSICKALGVSYDEAVKRTAESGRHSMGPGMVRLALRSENGRYPRVKTTFGEVVLDLCREKRGQRVCQ